VRQGSRLMMAVVLLVVASTPALVWARHVGCADVLIAGAAFRSMVTDHYGRRGDSSTATIEGCQEFKGQGKLLGYFLPVSPKGYIMINQLTQMSPVKAFSTESDLDITRDERFARLLRDTMGATRDFLGEQYGPLAKIPEDVDLTPMKNRETWNFLLGQDPAPSTKMDESPGNSWMTVGPLLTSSWNQAAPFNNFCPMSVGSRTLVGCVVTAAA
jgi:hypothetical protein